MREQFKQALQLIFITIGGILMILELIVGLYLSPKISSLYQELGMTVGNSPTVSFIAGFLLSLLLIVIGLKYRSISKNNLLFYLTFAFLIIGIYLIVGSLIFSTIIPIYQLTTSIN